MADTILYAEFIKESLSLLHGGAKILIIVKTIEAYEK